MAYLALADCHDQRPCVWTKQRLSQTQSFLHKGEPLAVPVAVAGIHVIVVVPPVSGTGVVGRIDVYQVNTAVIEISHGFKCMVVLSIYYNVVWLAAAAVNPADAREARVHRFPEFADDDKLTSRPCRQTALAVEKR